MEMDQSASVNEYYMTANHIFDYCGTDSTGLISVDDLMDKFAPFVKTNKSEFEHLKSLLDPEHENPKINASNLARALAKYSESQKVKVDLDESFNLRGPLDSDSGISSDGFQLLEELQCELREKSHLAHQLRSQLDFTDRQHEEAISSLTAERDSLRAHLNMLREENVTLTHVKSDYEETCDRLCSSEQSLEEARRELEASRRRNRALADQISRLENEKSTLQELLASSKAECHRINEMYSQRQAALLDQTETLRAQRAGVEARLEDAQDCLQILHREKVLLEMELKDLLNKSCAPQLPMDSSIDVSLSDEHVLSALDSLTADSRFSHANQILSEESFTNALQEDQGRATSMSLFDEMRLSFCNMSKNNTNFFDQTECQRCKELLDTSMVTAGTQTDEGFNENTPYANNNSVEICNDCSKAKTTDSESQTETNHDPITHANKDQICVNCQRLNNCKTKLESDLTMSHSTISEMQGDLEKYEANLDVLENYVKKETEKNNFFYEIVESLKIKICILEAACAQQKVKIDGLACETCTAEAQTDNDVASTAVQVDTPCAECVKRTAVVPATRTLRRYFWDPLKSLFQLFAVICFVCAVSALYGVTRRWHARCSREAVPWSWITAQDVMDLFFRIEYVADVPM